MNKHDDWCEGCTVLETKRVNLPEHFKEGDTPPDNLTVHATKRDPRRFAFIGDPRRQNRHYFD